MTVQHPPTGDEKTDINPYVSGLASRLMRTAAKAEIPMDSQGWQLITEVLSYAASAEQRMAEQQERISYLEHLSVTDELTGITNRRGLKNALGRIFANAARHGEPGILAFIDLDDFKGINDAYGHGVGDAVLRHVAQFLKREIRPQDLVSRVSGDEFALVLTRCNLEQGQKRLHSIQQKLNDNPVVYGGLTLAISCSVGLRAYDGASDPRELIEQADQDMYLDKQSRKSKNQQAS